MKACVWQTGHGIADTVAQAVHDGLHASGVNHSLKQTSQLSEQEIQSSDVHIGYGILRGMDEVFRACDKAGKPWFNIDKGYWKPGHYDGYYRISLRGTQQTFGFDKLKPDYERWDKLGIEILPSTKKPDVALCCPPTDYVDGFFDGCSIQYPAGKELIIKSKTDPRPINYNLYDEVVTFNSSVGWEALRHGIPVISDINHSIIGAYVKHFESTRGISFDKAMRDDSNVRRELFALMALLQLTLDEIRAGLLWPFMQNLLNAF